MFNNVKEAIEALQGNNQQLQNDAQTHLETVVREPPTEQTQHTLQILVSEVLSLRSAGLTTKLRQALRPGGDRVRTKTLNYQHAVGLYDQLRRERETIEQMNVSEKLNHAKLATELLQTTNAIIGGSNDVNNNPKQLLFAHLENMAVSEFAAASGSLPENEDEWVSDTGHKIYANSLALNWTAARDQGRPSQAMGYVQGMGQRVAALTREAERTVNGFLLKQELAFTEKSFTEKASVIPKLEAVRLEEQVKRELEKYDTLDGDLSTLLSALNQGPNGWTKARTALSTLTGGGATFTHNEAETHKEGNQNERQANGTSIKAWNTVINLIRVPVEWHKDNHRLAVDSVNDAKSMINAFKKRATDQVTRIANSVRTLADALHQNNETTAAAYLNYTTARSKIQVAMLSIKKAKATNRYLEKIIQQSSTKLRNYTDERNKEIQQAIKLRSRLAQVTPDSLVGHGLKVNLDQVESRAERLRARKEIHRTKIKEFEDKLSSSQKNLSEQQTEIVNTYREVQPELGINPIFREIYHKEGSEDGLIRGLLNIGTVTISTQRGRTKDKPVKVDDWRKILKDTLKTQFSNPITRDIDQITRWQLGNDHGSRNPLLLHPPREPGELVQPRRKQKPQ